MHMLAARSSIPAPIIPMGDSLPGFTIHTVVTVPPKNVAGPATATTTSSSGSASSTPGTSVSHSASASPATTTASTMMSDVGSASIAQATATATPVIEGPANRLEPGAIVGIVLGILTLLALTLFAIRYYFVRQRSSKLTPARARASHVVISGPTNFQHVDSGGRGDGEGEGEGGVRNPDVWKEDKYNASDVGTMESGLRNHVQIMQAGRP